MKKYNAANERAKHSYFEYMKEALGLSEASVDAAAQAIARFEEYTDFRDFKKFRYQQAVGFKKKLLDQKSLVSGKPLSKSTVSSTLNCLKAFFTWLVREPGYRSRISFTDAEYFHLSAKDTKIAGAKRTKPVPTLDQIRHVLQVMPSGTDIEKRDRALIAFAILTGARDGAIASFKLKHIDVARRCVIQDAREVATKFSKTFTTYFFQVGADVEKIFLEWVEYLKVEKLWGLDDPLFPSTKIEVGNDQMFRAVGIDRIHWSDAGPIRRIFKTAFIEAGLPYYNPHSFRNTLARLAGEVCSTPEQYKAWSQNLGHGKPLTTMLSYGYVDEDRQEELIAQLGSRIDGHSLSSEIMETLAESIVARLQQGGLSSVKAGGNQKLE